MNIQERVAARLDKLQRLREEGERGLEAAILWYEEIIEEFERLEDEILEALPCC